MRYHVILLILSIVIFPACSDDELIEHAVDEFVNILNAADKVGATITNFEISEGRRGFFTVEFSDGSIARFQNTSPIISRQGDGHWYVNGEDSGLCSRDDVTNIYKSAYARKKNTLAYIIDNGADYEFWLNNGVCYVFPRSRQHLKILAFGNSWTLDALSYVPFIMKSVNPDCKLTLSMATISGGSLENHLERMSLDRRYEYNGYESDEIRYRMYSILARHLLQATDWDIILLHQVSYQTVDYSTYQPVSDIIKYIYANCLTSTKIGWLLTPALPNGLSYCTSDEMFYSIGDCVRRVCEDFPIDIVLPCGTALQNARTTLLDKLSDGERMTSADNWHLQEGLPCLVEAYAATEVLLANYFPDYSIMDDFTDITNEFVNVRMIPDPNGGVVEVTEEYREIAKRCAIEAVKRPYEITIIY